MRPHAFLAAAVALGFPVLAACAIGTPPAPPKMSDGAMRRELLRVTKNENANYVVYDQILDDSGKLADVPLDVYWIMGAEDGQREELNSFERDIYGATIEHVDREQGHLAFVINAFKAKKFEADVAPAEASAEVFTTIDGGRAQVTDIHLTVKKTWNPLRPDVEVRLTGKVPGESGTVAVEEIIKE